MKFFLPDIPLSTKLSRRMTKKRVVFLYRSLCSSLCCLQGNLLNEMPVKFPLTFLGPAVKCNHTDIKDSQNSAQTPHVFLLCKTAQMCVEVASTFSGLQARAEYAQWVNYGFFCDLNPRTGSKSIINVHLLILTNICDT